MKNKLKERERGKNPKLDNQVKTCLISDDLFELIHAACLKLFIEAKITTT